MRAFFENKVYEHDIKVIGFKTNELTFPAYYHNDIELIYVAKGSIEIGINSLVHRLKKGQLSLIASNDIHHYKNISMDCEFYILMLKPEIIDCKLKWPENKRLKFNCIDDSILKKSAIDSLNLNNIGLNIEFIIDKLKRNNKQEEYFIKAKLFELFGVIEACITVVDVDERVSENQSNYNLDVMYKAITYIEEKYKMKIYLEEVADYCNLSVYHFSRVFSKTIGQTFTDYANNLRAIKAKELLMDTKITILEVAYFSGSQNLRSFNRNFKKFEGITPSEFQKASSVKIFHL